MSTAEKQTRQLNWLSSLEAIDTSQVMSANTRSLLDELQADAIDIKKITHILTLEPALTAKILMITNSPFYGYPREIKDIEEAVVLLGSAKLANIIYSSLVMVNSDDSELKRFIKHSLVTALYAKAISESLALPPEGNFMAGLLHVLPVIVNFEPNITQLLNAQTLAESTKALLNNLSLPTAVVNTVSGIYLQQSRDANTALLKIAFNLSIIALGKSDAPFKHLINTEHEFNRLGIAPSKLTDIFFEQIPEKDKLLKLVS